MSEESKCDCQHCGVHIEFPAEMAEQTVTCPHCQAETLLSISSSDSPPAPDSQPQIEDLGLFFSVVETLLEKKIQIGCPSYILYLAPGDVRYLGLGNFMKYKPEGWIAYFKQIGLAPEIKGPYNGKESCGLDPVIPEQFFPNPSWEDRFKILHGFVDFQTYYNVAYSVYTIFHAELKLRSLEFIECADSWEKESWDDFFIAQSFTKSDQHLLFECEEVYLNTDLHRIAVFKKTPFVMRRLEELRKLEEAEKTAENLERLRRSNFKIFVYLMEDLRNGLFKIGQSQTPENREKTLQSEVPETSLRFYMPAHDTAETELHEMILLCRNQMISGASRVG
jgi:hypothetical protein